MGLYQRHRPNSLEELKGNQDIISTLSTMLEDKEKVPCAFLLTGPTGTGKTTIARIIANKLGCVGNDLREIDAADFRGIDTIREIRKNLMYKPLEGEYRIWVLDEVHRATGDAMSALLKMLEDCPKHVRFILCTTDPQKLLPTLRGRCSIFQTTPLSDTDMFSLLKKISRAEGQKIEKEVLDQIVQDSQGHPRNAINILEQVLCVDPEKQLQVARRSAEQQSQMIELCRALIAKKRWKEIAGILSGLKEGNDAESIRRMVLGYCQAILLKGENTQAGLVMECFIPNTYDVGFPGIVFACYSSIQ
jgi:DNA polymerase-3 subunit gamma/tau